MKKLACLALPHCQAQAKSADAPLLHLEDIEITLVTDAEIARVHGEFLDDPTPTDVITFHHGEILISAETAAAAAPEHGQSLDEELALYLIHGLLHLSGWEDETPADAAAMAQTQAALLRTCLNALSA
ncbi:MAG: rRNA maturation RNase YbeY [Prosthecobacter sp.]|nr:rRNA maturation RNase YbeY [Prosthecobacter sp.]